MSGAVGTDAMENVQAQTNPLVQHELVSGIGHAAAINTDLIGTVDTLAELIARSGHCDKRTIERGRRVAVESGRRLDMVLLQLGLITERGLAACYAALLGLPIAGPERYPASPVLADRLRPRFLRGARVMPLAATDCSVALAVADPLDRFGPAAVATATGRAVTVEIAVPLELEAAFDRLYPDKADAGAAELDRVEHAASDVSEDDAERLKDLASEAPVIRLVNQMLARAVETKASDIHIEPFDDQLRVRYRWDGVLHEADSPPLNLTAAIISRIKIMARLDIAERRLPQDGRIGFVVRGQEIDFRVSTLPSLYGESIVLRVLDRGAMVFDYAALGLHPAIVQRLSRAFQLPNGIVLVTGPVGSGKTTTLYTGLLSLSAVARKIVTVEDPVEYQLRGITQIPVRPQIGLHFATLLRGIVRHDPNVIMVGEIRDLETAQIAVQAALTGRLVLSTLHTNSAAASITRLRDMGLENYQITAVLRGVLAQRLVRRLCPLCRQPVEPAAELIERFELDRRCGGQPMIWRAIGCPECRDTGYRGRLAIAEFLEPNEEIERMIFARADHVIIERAAAAGGMVTMFEAGMAAALDGTTTIDEVINSIRAEA
jgi:general secretion pathway protein E